ncbi:MAG: alanine racemase [Patescibacteria group bacterium]|nr:alanine racemase [Patescibacteria group bacterium]
MSIKNQHNYRTWVEVSDKAISKNISAVRNLLSRETDLVAVVKSNAYGHGLMEVVQIAYKNNVKRFAVDSIDEALKIRSVYSDAWILVMGYILPVRLYEAIDADISFVAYSDLYLSVLESIKTEKKAKVHLKIETGTMRQGLCGEELSAYAEKVKNIPQVLIEGMYTHFANIEDTSDHIFAEQQLKNFNSAIEQLKNIGIDPPLKHTACSAAIILLESTHFNIARLGISLYGLWSSKETKAISQQKNQDFSLSTALTWKTTIAQIKNVEAGTAVSYGLTESVARNSKLAILPVGYWDGYDRGLSSVGNVLVGGKRCKVIGRVCMNMMIVDVTDAPEAHEGSEVVLLGSQSEDQITADMIAGKINTINYEVVTRINPNLPRIIVED